MKKELSKWISENEPTRWLLNCQRVSNAFEGWLISERYCTKLTIRQSINQRGSTCLTPHNRHVLDHHLSLFASSSLNLLRPINYYFRSIHTLTESSALKRLDLVLVPIREQQRTEFLPPEHGYSGHQY